jgi:hypothetical protein
MKNKTKIYNSGQYMTKAPEQIKAGIKGKVAKGGDLRAAKSGGQKAKGAI